MVHGDLACHNVFMEGPRKILISDFGLSHDRHEEGVYVKTMTGRLPLRWMALESITEGEFSSATDVWAFGVTLWEIVTLGEWWYCSGESEPIPNYETAFYGFVHAK